MKTPPQADLDEMDKLLALDGGPISFTEVASGANPLVVLDQEKAAYAGAFLEEEATNAYSQKSFQSYLLDFIYPRVFVAGAVRPRRGGGPGPADGETWGDPGPHSGGRGVLPTGRPGALLRRAEPYFHGEHFLRRTLPLVGTGCGLRGILRTAAGCGEVERVGSYGLRTGRPRKGRGKD